MAIYNENEDNIFCEECGTPNKRSVHICQECKKEIIMKKPTPCRTFFENHIKSETKERVTDSVFNLIRKFVFSHLYGTVLTVSIVATVAVSAVSTVSYSKPVNISIPITATQQQPAPAPEPEEPELTKETPAYEFLGKTLGEVKEVWGPVIRSDNFDGGIFFEFSGASPVFFVPNMLRSPQDSDIINSVSVNDDCEILPGITGNSTFGDFQAALPDENLAMPERTYDEMDGEWSYSLAFNYEGNDVFCTWYEDPATNPVSHIQIIDR